MPTARPTTRRHPGRPLRPRRPAPAVTRLRPRGGRGRCGPAGDGSTGTRSCPWRTWRPRPPTGARTSAGGPPGPATAVSRRHSARVPHARRCPGPTIRAASRRCSTRRCRSFSICIASAAIPASTDVMNRSSVPGPVSNSAVGPTSESDDVGRSPAEHVGAGIGRDHMEPRVEPTTPLEAVDGPPCPDERLLGDVLGVGAGFRDGGRNVARCDRGRAGRARRMPLTDPPGTPGRVDCHGRYRRHPSAIVTATPPARPACRHA